MLQYWKRKVRLDFMRWYNCNRESWEDNHADNVLKSGLRAILKVNGASFWEWDKGSSLFFWRFPRHYQEAARTGIAPMFDSNPPQNNYRQELIKDANIKEKVREKVKKVLDKGYIKLVDLDLIEAFMHFFHVRKGEKDIRMVYDASKSGLNSLIWAPWFALPTAESMVRWVIAGSWLQLHLLLSTLAAWRESSSNLLLQMEATL